MTGKQKAHIATLTANLIYGANFSIAKIVMPEHIKPAGFILLRVFFATILFFIMSAVTKNNTMPERKDMGRFFLLGLFGVAINQLLFFEGLSRTSNINAALIMTTNPVLVFLFAGIIFGEIINWQRIIGILCGLIGAGALILMSRRHGIGNLDGDLMVFINATSYAIFMVMAKPMMRKYHPWIVLKWTFFFGTLMVIPFGYNQAMTVDWASFDLTQWSAVVFVIFFTTFLAYLLNTVGLKELSPSVVSYYIYIQPVFATIISLIIQHEPLKWVQIVSCLVIFTGVRLVTGPTLVKAKS